MSAIVANPSLAVISALKHSAAVLKHNGKAAVVQDGPHNNGSRPLMLTLIALSAALMQQTPAPPPPPAREVHTRVMVMGGDGPGGLDRDGDGQVTREEFAAPMNDHFARMDANGDGRLSTEELSAGHAAMAGGDHDVRIMHGPRGPGETRTMVFVGGEPGPGGAREIVVRGGPGGHADMMAGAHGEGGPGERIEIRRMVGPGGENDLDADNDGKISEAEFSAPLREAFARMDADGSGFIEAGERGAGHGSQVFVHRIETRPGDAD